MDALDLTKDPQEYSQIGMAMLTLLSECPELPAGLPLTYNGLDAGECIGLYTLGGTYTEDVTGGYNATLNFQVSYKSYPNSNVQSINAQEITDRIMAWLRSAEKPALTGGRTIVKINTSDSIPYISTREGDSSTVYVANGFLNYEK